MVSISFCVAEKRCQMLECVVMKVRFILLIVVSVVFVGVVMGQTFIMDGQITVVTGTVTDVHGDAIAGAMVRCRGGKALDEPFG